MNICLKTVSYVGGTNKEPGRAGLVQDRKEQDEIVWCVTVPAGNIVIRRHGKVAIVGNSGRILRPFPGKERGLILDHSPTSEELGYPTEELPLVLDDGKAKESKEGKPKEKVAKLCPSCQYLKPAGEHKCSHCGFVPERVNDVVAAPGTLSKLERKKKNEYSTDEKRQLYRELKTLGAERGWSKGRLAHVFKDLTTVWPNNYQQEAPLPCSVETKAKVQHLAIRFAKSKQKPENRPEA
jgi:hypothetical protein